MLEVFKEFAYGFLSLLPTSISIYFFGYMILKEKKNSIIYNILVFLSCVALYQIIFMTLHGTIKTILICILITLTFKLIFCNSLTKSLFASIAFIVTVIIPELLVTFIVILIFGKEVMYSVVASSIIGNTLISIAMILLTYVLRKPIRKLMNYRLTENKKLILFAGLTFITLLIFFYSLIKTFQFNNNILAYLIIIISLICVLGYMFKQKIENEKISKRYDELLDIMKTYENDIEDQRTFIHETRNELATIRSKISDNEKNKEIIKYIDSVIGDKVSSNMSKYSKFMYLPKNGLKGFFYYKCTEASKKNIKVKVNISKSIENSFLKDIDTKNFKNLVRIIGVFLDNAIEASYISKDKKMGIEIYLIKDNVEMVISNTFINDVDQEKIGNEKYTTKGKHHGYGLLLVKRILKESNMLEVENKINNNIYTQIIRIKNKN